jgi:hypothetical protein
MLLIITLSIGQTLVELIESLQSLFDRADSETTWYLDGNDGWTQTKQKNLNKLVLNGNLT